MRDAHEKNHVSGRFAGRRWRIGGKRKRRHHHFVDRNRKGRRIGNFVRRRLRIGMKLVGVGELPDLNGGRRSMNFSRRRRLRLRQHGRLRSDVRNRRRLGLWL